MKHNNQLPNAHFHKHWQERVKTWFDQPGRKRRRRSARVEKAKRLAPRPAELLRPAVRCPTLKYNIRLRAGKGFTLDEIKAAGLTYNYARSVGIAVDRRRRNRSEESLALNKQRLLAYLDRLIVFPTKGKKEQKGDEKALQSAVQVDLKDAFPITNATELEPARKITAEEKKSCAYATLRKSWRDLRNKGRREKAMAEAAEGKN